MRKSEIYRKLIVLAIAMCGLSIGVMAQQREMGPRSKPWNPHGMDMLNLSEEQRSEIQQIRMDRAREIQPLRDEVRINKAMITAQMHKDKPDMKQIVGMVEENGRILTQIRVKEIESRIKIRSLLSDEQKVIFDAGDRHMQGHRQMAEHMKTGQHPQRRKF